MAHTRRKLANKDQPHDFPVLRLWALGRLAALGLLLGFSPPGLSPAKAQADASRSLESTESEPAATGEGAPSAPQNPEKQIRQLKAKVGELERRNERLAQSFAVADAEADLFREQYQQLRLQNVALGMDALTGDEKALRQRLVLAVSEGYQREMQRREAVNLLGNLLVAARRVLAQAESVDAERRDTFEVAARLVEGYLTGTSIGRFEVGQSLQDGKVVDVNDKLSMVILNIGSGQGVEPGMPFSILRNGSIVGKVKVYNVFEQFSYALIESREHLDKQDEPPLIGDKVKVWTSR